MRIIEATTAMLPIIKIPTTASATDQLSDSMGNLRIVILTLSSAVDLKSQCWLYR